MPNFEADKQAAAKWASHLLQRSDWVILDSETVDLYGVVCEIGIIDSQGQTLFESLINPECKVAKTAQALHGISDEILASAPTLPLVWQQITDVLCGRSLIIAYNALFDRDRLVQSSSRYGLAMLAQKWQCAMKVYAQFFGVWNEKYQGYRWQPLGSNHRAIGDCLATLGKIREMAACYKEESYAQE